MIYIKVYGIEDSGTNYTNKLIEINFENVFNLHSMLGWKHAPFPKSVDWEGYNWTHKNTKPTELTKKVTPELKQAVSQNNIRYIVVAKHPYANYASNVVNKTPHKRKYKYKYVPIVESIDRWTQRYNSLYNNWLDAHEQLWKYSCLVKYEQYLINLHQTLQRIQQTLNLSAKDDFQNVTKQVRADYKLGTEFDQSDWYVKQTYLSSFCQNDIQQFNQHLDPRILNAFGHTLANPEDFPVDKPPPPC